MLQTILHQNGKKFHHHPPNAGTAIRRQGIALNDRKLVSDNGFLSIIRQGF